MTSNLIRAAMREEWFREHALMHPGEGPAFLLGLLDEARIALEVMRQERDALLAAVEYARLADRSKPYKYGEARADGMQPPVGSRWLTPAEKAVVALDLTRREP